MEMNQEQDIARFIVEKTRYNLFLTGKAGTGKTMFLQDIKRHTKKKYVVLAPTGIAAINAGAMTIHSFFQFGFGPYIKGVHQEQKYNFSKSKLELINEMELLIIDEVSMVRADVMDHINDSLQRLRKNFSPFGGVQVLMVGDLQQLPPVVSDTENAELAKQYKSLYFFDSKALRSTSYYCVELQKVYRQTDQHFVEILNRSRCGALLPADVEQLNSRYNKTFRPGAENYIRLVTHNKQADEINERELAALEGCEFTFPAEVSSGFNEDAFPTSPNLVLKKGAQVMFIRNDPERRFVNGSLGVIEEISEEAIWVSLSDSQDIIEVKKMTWEDVKYTYDKQSNKIVTEVRGTFQQYPLRMAWAITVHKSQGLTFDRAIIDVHSAFSPGQAYVALSRCRTLEGIVLSAPVSASVFFVDEIVKKYLETITMDPDMLMDVIGYEPFDYDRKAVETPLTTAIEDAEIATVTESDVPDVIYNQNIYDALRLWRRNTAYDKQVRAFMVFGNKTLRNISAAMPASAEELSRVYGVGPHIIEEYGPAILDVIARSLSPENQPHLDIATRQRNRSIRQPKKSPQEVATGPGSTTVPSTASTLQSATSPTPQSNLFKTNPLAKALKDWRTQVALEKNFPPYCIFNNYTLEQICEHRPTTPEELSSIPGLGCHRIEQYGTAILRIVEENRQEPPVTE